MTPSGIEPVTFRFVAQHLNHCATPVPHVSRVKVKTSSVPHLWAYNHKSRRYFPLNFSRTSTLPLLASFPTFLSFLPASHFTVTMQVIKFTSDKLFGLVEIRYIKSVNETECRERTCWCSSNAASRYQHAISARTLGAPLSFVVNPEHQGK